MSAATVRRTSHPQATTTPAEQQMHLLLVDADGGARGSASPDNTPVPVPSAEAAYRASIANLLILHPVAERQCALRMRAGDAAAKTRLYESALRWIHTETQRICHWYGVAPSVRLDIVQSVNLVIWQRLHRYDPARGRLTSWVALHLQTAVPRAIEEHCASVRRPAWVQEADRREQRELERELSALDEPMGAPRDEQAEPQPVIAWRPVKRHPRRIQALSLDIPYADGESDGDPLSALIAAEDVWSNPEEQTHRSLLRSTLARMIASTRTITAREREVIVLFYSEDRRYAENLAEIAKALGITRERTRQIHDRAITKLRLADRRNGALRALYDEMGA